MCLNPNYCVRYIADDGTPVQHFIGYVPKKKVESFDGPGVELFPVGCGKCSECQQAAAEEWAFRVMDEASLYEKNCFVTLTYDSEHLPEDGCVNTREPQLFIKRVREAHSDVRIRVFYCGEYGGKFLRPHYHVILFNFDFDDKYKFCFDNAGNQLWRSPELEKLWTLGISAIGEVTLKSAHYVSKDMQKYLFDDIDKLGLTRPFIHMSNRPGIGYSAITGNIKNDKIYRDGRYTKLPRYYLKCLEAKGVDLTELKENRIKVAKLNTRSERELERARQRQIEFVGKLKKRKPLTLEHGRGTMSSQKL